MSVEGGLTVMRLNVKLVMTPTRYIFKYLTLITLTLHFSNSFNGLSECKCSKTSLIRNSDNVFCLAHYDLDDHTAAT
jgi:hypothetical protein